jgi:hypothetical protein
MATVQYVAGCLKRWYRFAACFDDAAGRSSGRRQAARPSLGGSRVPGPGPGPGDGRRRRRYGLTATPPHIAATALASSGLPGRHCWIGVTPGSTSSSPSKKAVTSARVR